MYLYLNHFLGSFITNLNPKSLKFKSYYKIVTPEVQIKIKKNSLRFSILQSRKTSMFLNYPQQTNNTVPKVLFIFLQKHFLENI